MITAQIMNGTIDPNWILTTAVIIVGFLLVRILNRIEKRLEIHDNTLQEHGKELAVLRHENDKRQNGKA